MSKAASHKTKSIRLPRWNGRGRKPAALVTALCEAEKILRGRYPDQKIKAGSVLPLGASKDHGNKVTAIILCQDCGAERRVATSDLFQVKLCNDCQEAARQKRAKDSKKPSR